jgi:hypothetical protein
MSTQATGKKVAGILFKIIGWTLVAVGLGGFVIDADAISPREIVMGAIACLAATIYWLKWQRPRLNRRVWGSSLGPLLIIQASCLVVKLVISSPIAGLVGDLAGGLAFIGLGFLVSRETSENA